MFERFTERARQVVVLAQEEARILKHNYIGTEHLLLGLLREDEGLAARVLESLDVGLERTRRELVRIVGSGEGVSPGQMPFTPRAKTALEFALQEALTLRHNYIGTEHILLGLTRERNGVAIRLLLEAGLDPERLRAEVLAHLEPGGDAAGEIDAKEHHRSRLAIVEAQIAALARREEVVRVVSDAADRQAAKEALRRLLDVLGEPAEAVLDLRLTRLTRDEADRLEQERRALLEQLDDKEQAAVRDD